MRRSGLAPAVFGAVVIVALVVAAAGAYYGVSQRNSTVTSTATSTVTGPTITSTSTSTATETSTQTTTAPPGTTTVTSTVTGQPVTVTSTQSASTITVLATQVSTTTETKTSTTTSTVTETSSSASSQTTSTGSCTTSTTTASNATVGLQLVTLAQTFSNVTLILGENTTNGPVDISYSYALIYASTVGSLTTYKMAFVASYEGLTVADLDAWILSNGTLLATESSGQNTTGPSAEFNIIVGASAFLLLTAYDGAPTSLVPSADIHASGQQNITLGGVTMSATNYQADALPFTFQDCLGDSYSIDTFVLQTAIAPGSGFTLLTYLDMQGMQTVSGQSSSYSLYLKVLTVTLA